MAQIIRHRKGVLESVNGSTKRKAELLIVTGSSGITATNSSAMVFFGDGTDATAANKVLYGTSTPDLTGGDYGNSVDGIPYYNTSQNKLYILAKGGNIEVQSTANTGGTGIMSGSQQVADALNTDNRNINLGSGTGVTIKEIAEIIGEYFGKEIKWDTTKPMGDSKRLMNMEKANSYGFKPQVSLRDGITKTIEWYKERL